MLTSMLLGAALAAPGAPVPTTADPAPAGPAPWVLQFKADENMRPQIMVYRTQKVTQNRAVTETVDGKQVQKVIQEQVERVTPTYILLDSVNPTCTTAAGTKVSFDSVMKRAKNGVTVLISADGKPVSKSWLRAIDPETIILSSDSLISESAPRSAYATPAGQAPRLALLNTDAKGKVQVAYNPAVSNNNGAYYGRGGGRAVFLANGQQLWMDDSGYYSPNLTPSNTEAPVKPLSEIEFEAYDLKGKCVSKEEALKRLSAGGFVLVASENRAPDESFLKQFRGDLLVLVSQQLINVPTGKKGSGATAPAPALLPAVRGVIAKPALVAVPLKVAPAPAAPAPALKEAPKKDEAPVQKEAAPKVAPAPVAKPAVIRAVPLKAVPLPAPVEKEALPK